MKKTKYAILVALLLGIALPSTAQNNYIFYNSTYGYLINNGGNPGVSTSFNTNAIWIANNTMNSNRNVKSYTDNTKFFYGSAGSSNTNNGSFSLGNTNDNWRLSNNYLNRRNANRGYVRYNGSGFIVNSSNTDQNFTGLAITINSSTPSNPTISITAAAGLSNGGIQLTGNISGTYTPSYNYATIRNYNNNNNQTYYWTSTSGPATTTEPSSITSWDDATKNWAVTTGGIYASVSSDGLVTITGNPTGNIVVTLTVSKGGYTGTQTFTLTRATVAQKINTATVITGPTISPSSVALYYNEGNQAFTSSASANNTTTTVPAHTTLTNGGNTYYYYDGTLYNSTDGFSSTTATPTNVTLTWSISGDAASYLTRTPATGTSTTVTHSTQSPSDLTATLTVTASASGANDQTATATIMVYGPMVQPTITRNFNTISIATSNAGATIYYTTDGSTPTSNSTPYAGSFDLTASPTTVKAIAIRDGHNSTVATETFQIQLPAPVITVSNTGLATITAESGATIHYTIDGSTPTASSPSYSEPVQLTNPQTIMAIAVKTNYANSEAASADYITGGIVNSKVVLDDREDHSWSYYSDASLPEQMRSLNPADVKITYFGNGNNVSTSSDANPALNTFSATSNTVKVGIDADAHTFIYLKTLERTDGSTSDNPTGRCAYTTIPNPFSVRPTFGSDNTTKWRGFYSWRVKSISGGAIYDAATGGTQIGVGGTIDAETTVYFAPTSEYSMQVELEALWARAYVGSGYQASVSYERNFVIGGAAVNYPATYSAIYPNGTTDGTTTATSVTGTYDPGGARTLSYDTKFEYINLTGNRTYTANNHYLCFGRGISTANNAGTVQGINGTATDLDYTLRVESGQFSAFCFVRSGTNTTVSGRYLVKAIMGCDYDRATETNNKLSVAANSTLFFAQTVGFTGSGNKDQKTFDCIFKSGQYQSGYWTESAQNGNPESDNTIQNAYQRIAYLGQNSAQGYTYPGVRCVTVEGGEFSGMCGGRGVSSNSNNSTYMTPGVITFDLRITGGLFYGAVYGGAADNPSIGSRRFIITGGEIRSWVAGGCNGTGSQNGSGATDGNSYIYVGGKVLVGGDNAMCINRTNGGQVFGAGRGLAGRTSSVNYSYVAIADKAVVSNNNNNNSYAVGGNVYGGSYNGTIANEANVYILGGTVEGSAFGGSYGNGTDIPTANVKMTGGLVKNGVYGGSNNTGTVVNVTMNINGGTVGDGDNGDGIFGGGYGQPTAISGNVDLTLGVTNQTEGGVTVYGDVYGGSALGTVNTNTSNHTNVTLNKGTINGSLYGGALGSNAVAANVNGPVTVTVNGGTVNTTNATGSGAVYGCNNINGAPQSTVAVIINGTDLASGQNTYALDAVYGGGNMAPYNGTPTVTINNCNNSIEYVYGGGNAASVGGTSVNVYGGNVIGNIFGGGNGSANAADVNGNAVTNIYGGTIINAFGGSNTNGLISGSITITVNEANNTSCPVNITDLYGGGNLAPFTGDPTVLIKKGTIGNAYGGGLGSSAVVTGNTGITMTGGTATNLFGGGSEANVTGSVTINMQGGTVTQDIYGGGALANTNTTSGTTTTVNLKGGTIGNAYGGGLGNENIEALVYGDVTVNLNQGVADDAKGCIVNNAIFGCNNINGTPLGSVTVHVYATQNADNTYNNILTKPAKNQDHTLNNGLHDVKAVYGGGNMAAYKPNNSNTPTHVIIDGCGKTSIEYVYGGGNAAPVPATKVDINGSYQLANVFGGGNGKDALPDGTPNPGADVGIYEVDETTWNSAGSLQYTDPGNEKGNKKYILYGNPEANGSVIGTTQVYILGGVISQVFGGSNTKGDIVKEAKVILGDENLSYCEFQVGGVYGGSNEAYMSGSAGITMNCIEGMDEIYGGSKKADITKNIVLTINGGKYGKVFGGNNISGRVMGSITINIEQTGCLPIEIGELYGGGNLAPYSIYGYNGTETGDDGIVRPIPNRTQQQGETPYDDPKINIVSCKSINTIYGGGFKALMVGNPEININMVRGWINGHYDAADDEDPNKIYESIQNLDYIGDIGTVFGGGNQADVVGETTVNIGTSSNVTVHDVTKGVYTTITNNNARTDIANPGFANNDPDETTKNLTITVQGAKITGNVYGGGNNAAVTGGTNINVGPE